MMKSLLKPMSLDKTKDLGLVMHRLGSTYSFGLVGDEIKAAMRCNKVKSPVGDVLVVSSVGAISGFGKALYVAVMMYANENGYIGLASDDNGEVSERAEGIWVSLHKSLLVTKQAVLEREGRIQRFVCSAEPDLWYKKLKSNSSYFEPDSGELGEFMYFKLNEEMDRKELELSW